MHFFNENVWILIEISLKSVPRDQIDNIIALVQIMACHWPGNKPLSEPVLVGLLRHICVTQPQWVRRFCCVHEFSTDRWKPSFFRSEFPGSPASDGRREAWPAANFTRHQSEFPHLSKVRFYVLNFELSYLPPLRPEQNVCHFKNKN